jgi:four helix bundle protein
MPDDNPILTKSYQYALRTVRLYKYLSDEKREFVLSKQLLFTGTQIGAHVKAAQEAESRGGFFHEMQLALQEALRQEYWLQLLNESEYLTPPQFDSMHADLLELIKLLKKITRPTRRSETTEPQPH